MIDPESARARAEAAFVVREEKRRTDGEQAWPEYQARHSAAITNMERLRQLRAQRDAQHLVGARKPVRKRA